MCELIAQPYEIMAYTASRFRAFNGRILPVTHVAARDVASALCVATRDVASARESHWNECHGRKSELTAVIPSWSRATRPRRARQRAGFEVDPGFDLHEQKEPRAREGAWGE